MEIYKVAHELKYSRKSIFDLDLRVTFYARVSTQREEQEGSIDHQIQYFTELIQNNSNWTYVPGYSDKVRGEAAKNRPNFMKMIDDGKSGKFDLILTKEVSRFARNTIDSLTFTRELLTAGVGVLFENDGICTIDTDSELRLTIMSSIAADEVRKLSERVHWGHKRSIENGVVLGNSRIYGYTKRDGKLVIDEKQAEMVRLIFETYATGDSSARQIEQLLWEKGYRTSKGTKIQKNVIGGILQNPKYKGFYCGNKVRISDYRTKQQVFLPESEWVQYKDEEGYTVPAIVSEELWDRCAAIYRERSAVVKSHGRSFKNRSPITGKIFCGNDGSAYWRTSYSNSLKKGDPKYQWICGLKRKDGAKSCNSFAIMEDELYTILSEMFKNLVDNIDDYINDFIKCYEEAIESTDYDTELKQIRNKIKACHDKKDRLLDLYTDNIITKEEFQKKNETIASDIEKYNLEYEDLQNEISNSGQEFLSIQEIKKTIKSIYTDPEKDLPRDTLDVLTKDLIYKIIATPTDPNTMTLEIQLKTGNYNTVEYEKSRSAIIKQKMINAYKQQ